MICNFELKNQVESTLSTRFLLPTVHVAVYSFSRFFWTIWKFRFCVLYNNLRSVCCFWMCLLCFVFWFCFLSNLYSKSGLRIKQKWTSEKKSEKPLLIISLWWFLFKTYLRTFACFEWNVVCLLKTIPRQVRWHYPHFKE